MIQINSLKKDTLAQADLCVKCGLCSAQCPTYRLDGSENESPRGRIALAQALASNQLKNTKLVATHVNNCLVCQRCEKICPSGVNYSNIIANSRAMLGHSKFSEKTIGWISKRTHKDWKIIAKITRLLQKTGALRLLPIVSVSPIPPAVHQQTTAIKTPEKANRVSLFTGCTSHILDGENIADALKLLKLCGYAVSVPTNQVCCGALPKHKGLLDTARQCEKNNVDAFDTTRSAIIFLASACGATLKKYRNPEINSQSININHFLNQQNALAKLTFTTSNKRILVHEPCTEKNALTESNQSHTLLSHIPGIELISFKDNSGCCGAGGDYMITHRQNAQAIRQPLIQAISRIKPDVIVTSNYTCGIHIRNGLNDTPRKKLDIPVMHPIQLLLQHIAKEQQG